MSFAPKRIPNEYVSLTNNPIEHLIFEMIPDNFYVWNFVLFGPPDSYYEGGVYEGVINFPKNYPDSPPEIKFKTKIFHPNVYMDGKICISILHEGTDSTGYEQDFERWRPIQNMRTVFVSIISLLFDPNPDSPANIDAGKMFREDKKAYRAKIKDDMA
jgi:ubiquitin-conjugating enzyme E2 G1